MISVLFESHHLYYLPNFLPIIQEMRRRTEYEIYASIPHYMPKEEIRIFNQICNDNNILTVANNNEEDRIQTIINKKFDIIVLSVAHKIFSKINPLELITKSGFVYDIKSFYKKHPKIYRL